MKKPIFLSGLFLLVIILLGASYVTPVASHGNERDTFTAIYDVTSSNETGVYTWFNHDFSESYNYSVEEGSQIEVLLYDATDDNTELNLSIGNLDRTHIFDNETGSNLGTSYYNMSTPFGFIADTDWQSTEAEFDQQAFITAEFDTDASYKFGASTFNTVNVTFSDGFQTTHLVYNEASGVLYHANVTINNFQLSFDINSYIPQEEDESETDDSPLLILPILATLSTVVVLVRFSKHR